MRLSENPSHQKLSEELLKLCLTKLKSYLDPNDHDETQVK